MEQVFSELIATSAIPAMRTVNVKHEIAADGRTPPRNPFVSASQIGDKAKRYIPSDTGPTFPDPPYASEDTSKAKRNSGLEELAECVCAANPCPCKFGGGLTEPYPAHTSILRRP